ncbi:MAG: serine/threonine protein kinase [Gammaproteobacteria bacterium]|nr:serine/threonine protein kinase [Gammaproteobacteria bacterium]
MNVEVPYARLSPDVILAAAESVGFECDGSIIALASYENRVYQLGTPDGFIVAKFYRPGRWSDDAILEEHRFALDLAAEDIPVVPPIVLDRHKRGQGPFPDEKGPDPFSADAFSAGATLHEHDGYRFALFERRGGRWPELSTAEDRVFMGRVIGRMHAFGALEPFRHRATLAVETLGWESVEVVQLSGFVPQHLTDSYTSIATDVLDAVERRFADAGAYRALRIHGDCHPGNVLWTDGGPHFVDLDDCVNGPAVQDLWLFLSGTRDDMALQLADLLEGYQQFRDFDYRELHLVEALRSLRIIHYAAWLARRWQDPAFPRAFPWFAEPKYWEDHVLALREQRAALDEPPLEVLVP